MQQICKQLGLYIGVSGQGARAVLKREDLMNPTTEQLTQAKEKPMEEFFVLLFLYMAYCLKYGKIVKDTENAVLQKRILSQKM